MEDGDFYVTKHSNLSEVHIVFHLVANESQLRSKDSSSINSRHPALLGLRNILKVINNLRKLHHIYIFSCRRQLLHSGFVSACRPGLFYIILSI